MSPRNTLQVRWEIPHPSCGVVGDYKARKHGRVDDLHIKSISTPGDI